MAYGDLLKGVVMCQQPWAFLFLCQILSHYVSYSCSKTLAYGKKTRFLVKMSLIRMGLYVPAFILGYLSVKSWFLFWGIDLEGAKDLKWRKILQRIKNDHSCWWMVQLFKVTFFVFISLYITYITYWLRFLWTFFVLVSKRAFLKELNHSSTTMIAFGSLQNFMSL